MPLLRLYAPADGLREMYTRLLVNQHKHHPAFSGAIHIFIAGCVPFLIGTRANVCIREGSSWSRGVAAGRASSTCAAAHIPERL